MSQYRSIHPQSLTTTRRRFLKLAALSGALASAPASLSLSFAATRRRRGMLADGAVTPHTLVVVFLRGAADGLNLVAPADDADYLAAREESVRVTTATGLKLANGPTSQDWRLHPGATALKTYYDAGQLAFVHAAGLSADTRSHFQAQDLMERGITDPALIGSSPGWITRWLTKAGVSQDAFTAVAGSDLTPASLLGDYAAIGMSSPDDFAFYDSGFPSALTRAYATTPGALGRQARTTLAALTDYDQRDATTTDAEAASATQVAYDTDEFSQGLNVVATLIKLGLSPTVATVEFNSWDTHHDQNYYFTRNITKLNKGLSDFWTDMAGRERNITLVAMTEFGRRVASNADHGTDHGHGSAMILLGGRVAGGRIYGTWPGLASAALDHGDLAVTTDYRRVLGELVSKLGGVADPASLFTDLTNTAPLGVLKG